MNLFDDEQGGGRLNPADCIDHTCNGQWTSMACNCKGHLLMVWATGYIEHSPTKYTQAGKQSDVVVVDVVDLDQPDHEGYAGLVVRQVWWRNARLIGLLKHRLGRPKPIIGWMGLGTATMGKPPYELHFANADEDAVARASAWFAAHPDFRPTVPYTGQNLEAARVQAEQPEPQTKSQLLQMAERQIGRQHQSIRDASDAYQASQKAALPQRPPAPPSAGGFEEEPPF